MNYEVWRSQFGGDPQVVGRKLILNYRPTIVVGVMPPRFQVLAGDIWLPAILSSGKSKENAQHFSMIAHLKPGVPMAHAVAEVAVLSQRLATVYPKDHPKEAATGSVEVASLETGSTRNRATFTNI